VWCTAVIPTFNKLRQEDQEFVEDSLGYNRKTLSQTTTTKTKTPTYLKHPLKQTL
jgi:hypothetical protein